MARFLLIIACLTTLTINFAKSNRNPLAPEQIEHCLQEAEAKLNTVDVPSILIRTFYNTRSFERSKVLDTSHEFAAKVQARLTPEQQTEFDQGCNAYWPKMVELRDSTSCGKDLEQYIGIYNVDRDQYLRRHQMITDRLEMYQLCITVRCKQAYDRKQARLRLA